MRELPLIQHLRERVRPDWREHVTMDHLSLEQLLLADTLLAGVQEVMGTFMTPAIEAACWGSALAWTNGPSDGARFVFLMPWDGALSLVRAESAEEAKQLRGRRDAVPMDAMLSKAAERLREVRAEAAEAAS